MEVGKPLVPKRNPPEADLIMTPPYLARQIVDHFEPRGDILDPCSGELAFYNAVKDWAKVAPSHPFINIDVQEGDLSRGFDFFEHKQFCNWIITNPPYSILTPWLKHCYEVAGHVVLLVQGTAPFFNARLNDMEAAGFGIKELYRVDFPPEWVNAQGKRITFGTGLAAVHWQRGWTDGMKITDGRNRP